MKNLDQKRARQALNNIDSVPETQRKDYGSLAKSLPMMLQANGLAQTLVFLKSKASDKAAFITIVDHLSDWLNKTVRGNEEEPGDFLDWIVDKESSIYRQAANEAIEFSIWLRRFVEAQGWDD